MGYCEIEDVNDVGQPGSLPNPARLIANVYPSTNVLELDGHGLATDDTILFRAESGGDLPAPLAAGTTYYAIKLTGSTFSVAATAGGTAIDLTTEGDRVLLIRELPIARFIEESSQLVDQMVPAAALPFSTPYPAIVKSVTADLTWAKLLMFTGQSDRSFVDVVTACQKLLDRWARGVSVRGTNAPAPANLAVTSQATSPRGWDACGDRLP